MDHKQILHDGLRRQRAALLQKLEGLSERDARLPRTPTGTNPVSYTHLTLPTIYSV